MHHRYYPRKLESYLKLRVAFRRALVDLYCLQSVFTPYHYFISQLILFAKRSYVLIPRGGYNEHIIDKLTFGKRIYFHLIEKQVVKKSSGIICISDHKLKDILKFNYQKPIAITYDPIKKPGAPPSQWKPSRKV